MMAGQRPGLSLLPLLDDPDVTVVEAAAWACGEQQSVDDDVARCADHSRVGADDALVREACVAALGAIGDQRGLRSDPPWLP